MGTTKISHLSSCGPRQTAGETKGGHLCYVLVQIMFHAGLLPAHTSFQYLFQGFVFVTCARQILFDLAKERRSWLQKSSQGHHVVKRAGDQHHVVCWRGFFIASFANILAGLMPDSCETLPLKLKGVPTCSGKKGPALDMQMLDHTWFDQTLLLRLLWSVFDPCFFWLKRLGTFSKAELQNMSAPQRTLEPTSCQGNSEGLRKGRQSFEVVLCWSNLFKKQATKRCKQELFLTFIFGAERFCVFALCFRFFCFGQGASALKRRLETWKVLGSTPLQGLQQRNPLAQKRKKRVNTFLHLFSVQKCSATRFAPLRSHRVPLGDAEVDEQLRGRSEGGSFEKPFEDGKRRRTLWREEMETKDITDEMSYIVFLVFDVFVDIHLWILQRRL